MSMNQFIPVEYRIGSCLFGDRDYRVISDEASFSNSLLEEILDQNRQTPGTSYMTVCMTGSRRPLIMVPFHSDQRRVHILLEAMDEVMVSHMGTPGFIFPQDVVTEGEQHAYLFSTEDLGRGTSIRTLMPAIRGPRWNASISLFCRVQTLGQMKLTSNGISREQLRIDPETGEVLLWLNHTLSCRYQSVDPDLVSKHRGFLSLPDWTEEQCRTLGIRVEGAQRDIFSAAVAVFYMLNCGHPFIGHDFNRIARETYLDYYHSVPRYVLEAGSDNALATSELDELTKEQLKKTVPQLLALYDEIFMAVTHPQTCWRDDLSCWDPEQWIRALEADKNRNDYEMNRPTPQFDRWVYHLV